YVTVCPALAVCEVVPDWTGASENSMPVPVKAMICGLVGALSVSVSVPLMAPAVAGLKVTVTVQVAVGAMLAAQLLVTVKSAVSESVAALTTKAPLPVFVNFTGTAVGVPLNSSPKAMLDGVKVTAACVPVPASATFWGLFGASSETLTDALRGPVAVGWNETFTVHVALAPKLGGQLFAWAKSPGFDPEMVTPLIASALVPAFVMVTGCGALFVPTLCPLKVRLIGAIRIAVVWA